MTGLLPVAHGVRANGVVFVPQPSAPTLARRLKDAGYQTGAFVGAYVLDRRFGLADGFDTYDDRIRRNPDEGARLEAERRGGEVVDAAAGWLNTVTSPFFIWVHLYDPHAPYEPPDEFRAKAGGNAYDGEVAYADAQVARVVDALRKRGLMDATVVAIAGDHGEGLGEHGEQTHGMLAYDSTLKVPLILSGGAIQARVVRSPVSLADLAPTLSRVAGLAAAGPSADLLAPQLAERDVYAETRIPAVCRMARAVGACGGALETHSVVGDRALRSLERSRRAAQRCRGSCRRRPGHDLAPRRRFRRAPAAARGCGCRCVRAPARARIRERVVVAAGGRSERAESRARDRRVGRARERACADERGQASGRAAGAQGPCRHDSRTPRCSSRRMDGR